jgi:hypothetical protein
MIIYGKGCGWRWARKQAGLSHYALDFGWWVGGDDSGVWKQLREEDK